MSKDLSDSAIVKDFYSNYYLRMFNSEKKTKFNVADIAYKFTHEALEKDVLRDNLDQKILEIGAGNGEHLRFVKQNFREYIMVDKQKPKQLLFKNKKVKFIEKDINDCVFKPNSFDRVIITCVLHHLDNPFSMLTKIKIWLKPGGTVSIFLPCDPGIIVRLSRAFFVNPKAKKLGFYKYHLLNALEHKNHVWGLQIILKEIFHKYNISITYYPFNIPSNNFNLFSIWQITKKG